MSIIPNLSSVLTAFPAMKKEARAIVTGKEYLLKRFAQTAIKNAKFLLSLRETARYIARIVFPSVNREARLKENLIKALAEKQSQLKDSILIRSQAGSARDLAEKNQFPAAEKNALNLGSAKNLNK
jgi:hypothetical protein